MKSCLRNERLTLSLFTSLLISFSLFIFAPCEIYFTNHENFWFSLQLLLPSLAVLSAACFAAVFLLCFFIKGRTGAAMLSVMFAAGFAAYIQGNFLAGSYPVLDGEAIDWDSMATAEVLNSLLWMALIAVSLMLARFKPALFKKCVKFVCVVVVAVQVVTLGTLLITKGLPEKEPCYFSTDGQFELSSEGNIVTLVSDSLESAYVTRAFEEYPEFKEKLDGFVFFPDTVSFSSYTYSSIPTLITGCQLPLEGNGKQGMRTCLEETEVFDKLALAGYETKLYTNYIDLTEKDKETFTNAEKLDSSLLTFGQTMRLAWRYSELTAFKYAPHSLKYYFTPYPQNFSSIANSLNLRKAGIHAASYGDDSVVRRNFNSGIGTAAEKKQYRFIHMYGVHAPYIRDRSLIINGYADGFLSQSNDEKRYQIALGQLDLLCEFVDQLKLSGIYDCTAIVFTADHGHINRFNPTFMVKAVNAHGKLEVSDVQIDQSQDYIPFILDSASAPDKKASLFELTQTQGRERFVYNYFSNSGLEGKTTFRTRIAVNGKAYDEKAFEIVTDEFVNSGKLSKTYEPGDKLSLRFTETGANITGINIDGMPSSKTAGVDVRFDGDLQKAMTAQIEIEKVWFSGQRLIVRCRGRELFREALTGGEQTVTFEIPPECADNGLLSLEFEFPDCAVEDTDYKVYPQEFRSFTFGSMVIK